MQSQIIASEQVLTLVAAMPDEALGKWNQYGLLLQAQGTELAQEIAQWETAGDEDWCNFERQLSTGATLMLSVSTVSQQAGDN